MDFRPLRKALRDAGVSQRDVAKIASVEAGQPITESRVSRCLHGHILMQLPILRAACSLLAEVTGEQWGPERAIALCENQTPVTVEA